MRVKRYIFLLLFHFISHMVCAKPLDSIEIRIKAPFYKKQEVNLACSKVLLPSREIRFKLDSMGSGRVKIPVAEKAFWRLRISDINEFYILIDKGYDLSVYVDNKNNILFSGKGSEVNKYLVEDIALGEKFDAQAGDIERTMDKTDAFLKLVNVYQEKFKLLYEKHYTSIAPDKELDYILRSINQSYVLNQKQGYLNDLGPKLADEFKLEQKWKLDKNNLLNDSVLIRMENYPSLGNFGKYLTSYRNYYFLKVSGAYKSDNETIHQLFKRDFNAIATNPFYSEPVRKEQLFKELYTNLFINPLSPVLDSVFTILKEAYRHDTWVEAIDAVRKRKMHLMQGNVAPIIQGLDKQDNMVTLAEFKGKVIFIDNWATWCSGCIAALPHVFEIQKHFRENSDVKFIFLSHDSGDKEKWLRYLNDHPEFQGIHLLLTKDDLSIKEWDGLGTPQYIIIDKNGKIVNAFAETLTAIKEIEEALKK